VPKPQRLVVLPVDLALVFTAGRGWHYEPAPPAWWIEEQEALTAADGQPQVVLSLVPALTVPVKSCRPGSSGRRRRHEHMSRRRTA
jgi:hypothetical protein